MARKRRSTEPSAEDSPAPAAAKAPKTAYTVVKEGSTSDGGYDASVRVRGVTYDFNWGAAAKPTKETVHAWLQQWATETA